MWDKTTWKRIVIGINKGFLVIKWDDPRFDMAMLEVLDINGSLLHTFFRRSANLRQSATKLKTWLHVTLSDEAEEFMLQTA